MMLMTVIFKNRADSYEPTQIHEKSKPNLYGIRRAAAAAKQQQQQYQYQRQEGN